MNISEAKQQIKNAMKAYFTKDDTGEYVIPVEKQRPVFLMGPPGIGKTAIMEQVASEMGVGLLSYSMTHHTRQSALGLPFIEHKVYKGIEYDISEYTMSEIIASIYDMMEETGIDEGILFLDEINCVSETLAPIMLQFLQYKIFGRHRIPEGWIVVTAGNPPEYNNSVREFDIVTWDRLKRIDVEPDFDVWKKYAYQTAVHPSVLTYLEIKKSDFYKVETTVEGRSFVTARGWDDLSQMIKLYELHEIGVDEKLIGQYLQSPRIAKDFAVYYDLFRKYRSDYQVDKILEGQISGEIRERVKLAKFDERLSLLGLLLDGIGVTLKEVMESDQMAMELLEVLKIYHEKILYSDQTPAEDIKMLIAEKQREIKAAKRGGSKSKDAIYRMKKLINVMENMMSLVQRTEQGQDAFEIVKREFANVVQRVKHEAEAAGERLENGFRFCEEVFGDGQEMVIFVTELTANAYSSRFIGKYGCESYFRHNKELLFYERNQEISAELKELEL